MGPDVVREGLGRVRESAPLVHNITNYVVMNFTANALLALGASPVMAHAVEEAADMARIAGALVLNIGTLSPLWVEAMAAAGRAAAEKQTPIVLDPVGAGATPYRTDTALRLLRDLRPAIVRGNASEIAALGAARTGETKGVDSTIDPSDAASAARRLAAETGAILVISGARDIIVGGSRVLEIANGHPMMAKVTGMGCAATAIVGAFAAVCDSPFDAAACGMAVMGVAGEVAAERTAGEGGGPGTFGIRFLDALSSIGAEEIRRVRITE